MPANVAMTPRHASLDLLYYSTLPFSVGPSLLEARRCGLSSYLPDETALRFSSFRGRIRRADASLFWSARATLTRACADHRPSHPRANPASSHPSVTGSLTGCSLPCPRRHGSSPFLRVGGSGIRLPSLSSAICHPWEDALPHGEVPPPCPPQLAAPILKCSRGSAWQLYVSGQRPGPGVAWRLPILRPSNLRWSVCTRRRDSCYVNGPRIDGYRRSGDINTCSPSNAGWHECSAGHECKASTGTEAELGGSTTSSSATRIG